jgi:hypothetical protein
MILKCDAEITDDCTTGHRTIWENGEKNFSLKI